MQLAKLMETPTLIAPGDPPLVEDSRVTAGRLLLVALVVAGVATVAHRTTIATAIVLFLLIVLALYDWTARRLPERYSIPLCLFAAGDALANGDLAYALLGLAVVGGTLALLFVLSLGPGEVQALGFGDVVLAGAIGLVLGPFWGLCCIGTGAIVGVVVERVLRRIDPSRPATVPLGTYLALAAAVAMVLPGNAFHGLHLPAITTNLT